MHTQLVSWYRHVLYKHEQSTQPRLCCSNSRTHCRYNENLAAQQTGKLEDRKKNYDESRKRTSLHFLKSIGDTHRPESLFWRSPKKVKNETPTSSTVGRRSHGTTPANQFFHRFFPGGGNTVNKTEGRGRYNSWSRGRPRFSARRLGRMRLSGATCGRLVDLQMRTGSISCVCVCVCFCILASF